MANLEVHLDRADLHEVGANYSHFNMFKHLEAGLADQPSPSTLQRQARADALPAPRSSSLGVPPPQPLTEPGVHWALHPRSAGPTAEGVAAGVAIWANAHPMTSEELITKQVP